MDTASGIVKIVYFDEGSATDYVQLRNGGLLITEIETTSGVVDEGGSWCKSIRWSPSLDCGADAWFSISEGIAFSLFQR